MIHVDSFTSIVITTSLPVALDLARVRPSSQVKSGRPGCLSGSSSVIRLNEGYAGLCGLAAGFGHSNSSGIDNDNSLLERF